MPKVNINISATDDASAVLRKVGDALKDTNKHTESMTGSFVKAGGIMRVIDIAFDAAKDATIGLAKASLTSFGQMEQNQIALKTMLGSSEKMYQVIGEITKAAKETPFELQELVSGAKNLIAFGESSDTVVNSMKMLGDVAAGVSIPINELITKYGQIRTQGRAMTMDLREFAGRGIPIYEALSKTMGVTEQQVMQFATAGKIGFKEIENAFKQMTGETGKFGGLMEAQSKSLNGQLSNLSDSYDILLVQMGSRMEENAKRGVSAISQSLDEGGLLNKVMTDIGSSANKSIGVMADLIESTDERFRTLNGTAKDFKQGLADLQLEKQAGYLDKMTSPLKAVASLFSDQSGKIDEVRENYQMYIDMGINGRAELEKFNKQYDDLENGRMKSHEETKKKAKATNDSDNSDLKKKREAAVKYYNELIYNSKLAQASDEERIKISIQKEMEAAEAHKRYYKNKGDFERAQAILNQKTEDELRVLRTQKTAEMFSVMASVESKFFTSTSSESANAVGQMSSEIASSMSKMHSQISKVFADIAADSRKNGMTMGDGFKIGASVAVAALSSVNAVLSMQSQMVQASYQRQIDDLMIKQEKEKAILDEQYESLTESDENKEELRLAELEAYAESLEGKTDSEINYAILKKETELTSAKDSSELEKKKAAEKKAIDQKFAMEKWKLETEAFKAKQESDKSAVFMSMAIGVTQAWASSMGLPFPVNVAVGGTLSALMIGTGIKQIGLIDSQKPPSAPAFASGITNFEGGTALVGERGRELVNLPSGSNVITNENTESLMSGKEYTIINNIILDGRIIQQDIVSTRQASDYGGY